MNHLTKAELLAEIAEYSDDTPIIISIGARKYPIDCVITGNGNIYLESNILIGRPRKYKTPDEIATAKREKWQRANDKRRQKRSR